MMLDEVAFETALLKDDRVYIGETFARVSRWVIRHHVNHPDWMEWDDLVQSGVAYCFKALPRYDGTKALPYFAQVVKCELRHVVRRACVRNARTDWGEIVEAGEPDTVRADIAPIVLRTDAAAHFPGEAEAFVDLVASGTVTTLKEFQDSADPRIDKARARAFVSMLIEELKEGR